MTAELSAVSQIVQSVFESMLGLELRESDADKQSGPDRITASVHLAGEWNGAVLVECSGRQGRNFAARFLSIEAPPAVDDVVRDVLGEVANMIGGNLKCVLGRGIHLSMPSVVDGDFNWRLHGAATMERLAFDCVEGTFWVTVLGIGSQSA